MRAAAAGRHLAPPRALARTDPSSDGVASAQPLARTMGSRARAHAQRRAHTRVVPVDGLPSAALGFPARQGIAGYDSRAAGVWRACIADGDDDAPLVRLCSGHEMNQSGVRDARVAETRASLANRSFTMIHDRRTRALDHSRSFLAQRNSRARIARPSGITTTEGAGKKMNATPAESTAKPTMATPVLRNAGVYQGTPTAPASGCLTATNSSFRLS